MYYLLFIVFAVWFVASIGLILADGICFFVRRKRILRTYGALAVEGLFNLFLPISYVYNTSLVGNESEGSQWFLLADTVAELVFTFAVIAYFLLRYRSFGRSTTGEAVLVVLAGLGIGCCLLVMLDLKDWMLQVILLPTVLLYVVAVEDRCQRYRAALRDPPVRNDELPDYDLAFQLLVAPGWGRQVGLLLIGAGFAAGLAYAATA